MKKPARYVPYHRSLITDEEITAVAETLRSGWLTAGPGVREFEKSFSLLKGNLPCVAVNSCTSGLFAAMLSLRLSPGDEVITTPYTFVATSNSIIHAGGVPVFADIDPETLNIDPDEIGKKISSRTKAICVVHIGGNPCEMTPIIRLANEHGLEIIEDCAHAIEAEYDGMPCGTFGKASSFSFYPTKNITAGEGGAVICRDEETERMIRLISRHGIDKGTWQRMEEEGTPLYDVVMPGYKMNMTDLQAAIGSTQLRKMDAMYARRLEIRKMYDNAFEKEPRLKLVRMVGKPAHHLYQLIIDPSKSRNELVMQARDNGLELSVNYTPIHQFSWYREQFSYKTGYFPHSEYAGAHSVSLPFYPAMSNEDVEYVIKTILSLLD